MKLVALTALLSVFLVSSTVYLIKDQNQTELMNLPGKPEGNKCLTIFVQQFMHSYPEWDAFAQNLCSKPKKFTILYQIASSGPIKTNITKCLYKYQQEQTQFDPDWPVLSYTEEDC